MNKQQVLAKLGELQVSIQSLMNELNKDFADELNKDFSATRVLLKETDRVKKGDEFFNDYLKTWESVGEHWIGCPVGELMTVLARNNARHSNSVMRNVVEPAPTLVFIDKWQKLCYYYDENGVIVVKKNGTEIKKKRNSRSYLITLANNEKGLKHYNELLKKYSTSPKKLSKMYRRVGGFRSFGGNRYGNTANKSKVATHFDCYLRDRVYNYN